VKTIEVILSPSEIKALCQRDLNKTVCVVSDVLRATSSIVTALANGAQGILPVEEISEALLVKQRQSGVLLAGERNGVLIGKELTGNISFDLGNSPREFIRPQVEGKTIVMTTTNGTRALCACSGAARTLIGSFLNLQVTVEAAHQTDFSQILLVCAGTEEEVAYEDVLCAGAFIHLLLPKINEGTLSDSAQIAQAAYLGEQNNLLAGLSKSRNARRLLSHESLRDDVAYCVQRNIHPLLVQLESDGMVRKFKK
jgi:2-phosphosulfolactate phosphatase